MPHTCPIAAPAQFDPKPRDFPRVYRGLTLWQDL